jgi:hypothetical protein
MRGAKTSELGEQAAATWAETRATISQHLTSEDEVVLPFAEAQPSFPPDVVHRAVSRAIRKSYILS